MRPPFILFRPTPLLPDYAYGTWFTRWHPYTEPEVKEEIGRWNAGNFPLVRYYTMPHILA